MLQILKARHDVSVVCGFFYWEAEMKMYWGG